MPGPSCNKHFCCCTSVLATERKREYIWEVFGRTRPILGTLYFEFSCGPPEPSSTGQLRACDLYQRKGTVGLAHLRSRQHHQPPPPSSQPPHRPPPQRLPVACARALPPPPLRPRVVTAAATPNVQLQQAATLGRLSPPRFRYHRQQQRPNAPIFSKVTDHHLLGVQRLDGFGSCGV